MNETGTPSPEEHETLEEVRQRRQHLHLVLIDVENSLAAPAIGRPEAWAAQVVVELDALREALILHVETTEGPGGLYDQLVDDAPRLIHAVKWLRDDHAVLDETLTGARARARDVAGPDDVKEVRHVVLDVLGRFSRHRHRGADLVYEAYNVDISSGD